MSQPILEDVVSAFENVLSSGAKRKRVEAAAPRGRPDISALSAERTRARAGRGKCRGWHPHSP